MTIYPDPKPVRWENPEYLDYIRSQPCLSCGAVGIQPGFIVPHHVSLKNQGWGTKPPDYQTVPLCRTCHNLEETGYGMKQFDLLWAMVRLMGKWLERTQV
jgi:hypothetical protein